MENNLHILFFISSLGSGGAERVISVLAREFVLLGCKVDIVLISNRNVYYELPNEVNLIYLDCDKDEGLKATRRYLKRLGKIRHIVDYLSPDVVVSFMAETNIDVCLSLIGKKTPILVSERNDPKVDPNNKIKKILRFFAYFKPVGFVFQTNQAKSYFSNRIRIQRRSEIIMNPLSSSMPPVYSGERDNRIVSVGRLNPQKNIPMLISAFEEFSSAHSNYILEIYGEGVLENELKELIREKGLEDRVFLKGFQKDVHERIKNASLFVMPSNFEGMPNALIEAMAVGLPCISTDCPCGGPAMIIKNNVNGLLIPVGDCAALVQGMMYLVENEHVAKDIGSEASKIRNLTSSNVIADKWIQFIYKTMENLNK